MFCKSLIIFIIFVNLFFSFFSMDTTPVWQQRIDSLKNLCLEQQSKKIIENANQLTTDLQHYALSIYSPLLPFQKAQLCSSLRNKMPKKQQNDWIKKEVMHESLDAFINACTSQDEAKVLTFLKEGFAPHHVLEGMLEKGNRYYTFGNIENAHKYLSQILNNHGYSFVASKKILNRALFQAAQYHYFDYMIDLLNAGAWIHYSNDRYSIFYRIVASSYYNCCKTNGIKQDCSQCQGKIKKILDFLIERGASPHLFSQHYGHELITLNPIESRESQAASFELYSLLINDYNVDILHENGGCLKSLYHGIPIISLLSCHYEFQNDKDKVQLEKIKKLYFTKLKTYDPEIVNQKYSDGNTLLAKVLIIWLSDLDYSIKYPDRYNSKKCEDIVNIELLKILLKKGISLTTLNAGTLKAQQEFLKKLSIPENISTAQLLHNLNNYMEDKKIIPQLVEQYADKESKELFFLLTS